jgi:hypothetical protein
MSRQLGGYFNGVNKIALKRQLNSFVRSIGS